MLRNVLIKLHFGLERKVNFYVCIFHLYLLKFQPSAQPASQPASLSMLAQKAFLVNHLPSEFTKQYNVAWTNEWTHHLLDTAGVGWGYYTSTLHSRDSNITKKVKLMLEARPFPGGLQNSQEACTTIRTWDQISRSQKCDFFKKEISEVTNTLWINPDPKFGLMLPLYLSKRMMMNWDLWRSKT